MDADVSPKRQLRRLNERSATVDLLQPVADNGSESRREENVMRVPLISLWHRGPRAATLGLLLAVAAMSVVGAAQTTTLRFVSTAWPPFTNQTGQVRFALDLVEAAMGRIGVSTTTTIVDAGEFTSALLAGPFDGSAATWKDAERERVLLFSQPYLENRLILVGRRGSDVSAATLGALKGKRIVIVEGYSYGDAIDNAGPTFVRSRGEEDSLRLLLTESVDYMLMDEVVVQYIADHHAEEARAKLQLGSTPLVTRPLYLAVRRTLPDAQSIIERFNTQLRDMIRDRTYHRLLHVNWIRADVDGDGVAEYVFHSDRSGLVEPQRAYAVLITEKPTTQPTSPRRYFFGGAVYNGWSSVPDRYKVADPGGPNPNQPVARIFTFRW
jgi:polar amino acid transport system substrate-binding protein